MVRILSTVELLSLIPTDKSEPFESTAELGCYLHYALSQKKTHFQGLKSTDSQSFCALLPSTYSRQMLLHHLSQGQQSKQDLLDSQMQEIGTSIKSWDSRLDLFFKSIQFEKSQYFSI